MKIDDNKIRELIEEVTLLEEINLRDIPAIDLYMDQITTFFEDNLSHLKRDKNEPILTKTMINNYTKGKVLMPPTKKKYSKQHIILLILIYNLKQVLSINDIQALFAPLIKKITALDKEVQIEELYSAFLEVKEIEVNTFKDTIADRLSIIEGKLSAIDSDKQQLVEILLMVMMLVHQADLQKRLAEKLIDSFFKEKKEIKK